jgi:hypothetical protein
MTETEKRMNKLDLKSYKVNDTQIHSMIPGINNLYSVGSGPVRNINKNYLMSTLAGT